MLTFAATVAMNGASQPAEAQPVKSVEENTVVPELAKAEESLKEPVPAADADTEMKDAEPTTDLASPASAAAAPDTNGTPTAKSKRRSSQTRLYRPRSDYTGRMRPPCLARYPIGLLYVL